MNRLRLLVGVMLVGLVLAMMFVGIGVYGQVSVSDNSTCLVVYVLKVGDIKVVADEWKVEEFDDVWNVYTSGSSLIGLSKAEYGVGYYESGSLVGKKSVYDDGVVEVSEPMSLEERLEDLEDRVTVLEGK